MSPSNDVLLTVGNKAHAGWTKASWTRTIEAIANSFELTVTERFPGQQAVAAIQPGMACQLSIGADTIITGFMDDVDPEYDAENHDVPFRGRDKTGDLVDCSAIAGNGSWLGAPFTQIIADLVKPFGIPVSYDVPTGTFALFQLQPGETVFETIERMSTRAGVLPVSDGQGGLRFTRAGSGGRHSGIVLGENIKKARGHFSNKDRFSHYIVLGQAPGGQFVDPETTVAGKGEAFDKGITRYRPLIVYANVVDITQDVYQTRALWEAAVRLGRAWRHTITVQGWRDQGGLLWQPNRIVRVDDDFLGIHGDVLISTVKGSLTEEGQITELTITRPEAFQVAPLPVLPDYDPPPPQQRMFPPRTTKDGRL